MIKEDNYPDVLYKYLDYKGGLSMIENQELWFTRAKKLNDPYDCYHTKKLSAKYDLFDVNELDLNIFFGNVGICSLCADPSIFTMWSYYNQHEGFCIGVNMAAVKRIFGLRKTQSSFKYVTIKKVLYQDTIAKINLYDLMSLNYHNAYEDNFDGVQNTIHDFFAVKSKDWEREKEYRLILREGPFQGTDEPAKVRIENLIESVYIGCKNYSDLTPILELAKERKFKVYGMTINPDQYGLDRELLYEG